jgi:hypothetical protein
MSIFQALDFGGNEEAHYDAARGFIGYGGDRREC